MLFTNNTLLLHIQELAKKLSVIQQQNATILAQQKEILDEQRRVREFTEACREADMKAWEEARRQAERDRQSQERQAGRGYVALEVTDLQPTTEQPAVRRRGRRPKATTSETVETSEPATTDTAQPTTSDDISKEEAVRRYQKRQEGLAEITRISEEEGMYD